MFGLFSFGDLFLCACFLVQTHCSALLNNAQIVPQTFFKNAAPESGVFELCPPLVRGAPLQSVVLASGPPLRISVRPIVVRMCVLVSPQVLPGKEHGQWARAAKQGQPWLAHIVLSCSHSVYGLALQTNIKHMAKRIANKLFLCSAPWSVPHGLRAYDTYTHDII